MAYVTHVGSVLVSMTPIVGTFAMPHSRSMTAFSRGFRHTTKSGTSARRDERCFSKPTNSLSC